MALLLFHRVIGPRLAVSVGVALAAIAGVIFTLIRDLAQNETRALLYSRSSTPWLAGFLAILLIANVAFDADPLVVRIVPGTTLLPDLPAAAESDHGSTYSLSLWRGDEPEAIAEIEALAKPGVFLGPGRGGVRVARRREAAALDALLEDYLEGRVPDQHRQGYMTIWAGATEVTGIRFELEDELRLEVRRDGSSLTLLDSRMVLADAPGEHVKIVFLDVRHD
jgi:hypothetical protein